MKNSQKKNTPSRIGQLLIEERKQKGYSYATLAKIAGVSSRTIHQLETGEKIKTRSSIIIKLAKALGANAKEWSEIAGHYSSNENTSISNAIENKINYKKDSMGINQPPWWSNFLPYPLTLKDPLPYFQNLRKKVANDPYLACVCYTTLPSTYDRRRTDVLEEIINAINTGLWFAMFIPHPHPDDSFTKYIAVLNRLSLYNYYREVYERVISLARIIRLRIKPENLERVKVYCPNICEIDSIMDEKLKGMMEKSTVIANLHSPPFSPIEIRTMLLKKFPKESIEYHHCNGYELGIWLEWMGRNNDNFINLEFLPENPHIFDEKILFLWQEYFSDVISLWCKDKKLDTLPKEGIWRDITPINKNITF